MKIGLFTEFSYPGKSEQQTYVEVWQQIEAADALGYDFFSLTESYGKDLFSCSPFPLGLYVAAAQRASRIRFLTGVTSMPVHHPAMLASEVAAADLLTGGRIMVGIGRGHPWVINRLGVDAVESTARFEEGIRMLVEIFKGDYIEKFDGEFWQLRDFQLSPMPVQQPHPPIYTAAATTPDSAKFAGEIGQGLVQPGYLGIPFALTRGLTETYRQNLPASSSSDVILGIHLHVADEREDAIENGALALSSQAEVFLRGRLSRTVPTETILNYGTKSASREAFEKLHTPEKARAAVAAEGTNIMAIWGTPKDCIEKIKFYVEAMHPEQLMLNMASGSLPQEKVLQSMRLFAEEVMPAVKQFQ
ncbi:MAG TPA: LLM class flavin-dependent oxidoreductase [Terriglobales bacterium]|jgi:alkanesulfonate monooxygenase SsuD/methylene tetrahydromethanopterin reductase-like flavin-dependent oxidoreductase (luciferase family)|nr:LLM class flavin-dependent oxidoreductase [Terriglobales bacterium]